MDRRPIQARTGCELSTFLESLTTNTYRHLCEEREPAEPKAASKTFQLLLGVVDGLW